MALYTITLKQIVRSPLTAVAVALGAVCFSMYNPLNSSNVEDNRAINVLLGVVCAAVEILVAWAIVRYWHYCYVLITRTGSIWRTSFTNAFYALVAIVAALISSPIVLERVGRIMHALNLGYAGVPRLVVLTGASAWIVAEVLVSVYFFVSLAASPFLGLTALWLNRKSVRLWCVNKCRCRGTCRYPRVPY
jgi:hypothetical protein